LAQENQMDQMGDPGKPDAPRNAVAPSGVNEARDSGSPRCVVIGAGPAGLTAAHTLVKQGMPAVVFEADQAIGGISRTVNYRGYRFDIGGHRFFTKVDAVWEVWREILGDELLERPRMSRIYYNDRFFDYPLKAVNALRVLGPIEAVRILLGYLKVQIFPLPVETNFEQWVTNRFGRRLYEIFFKTYTEKVWGMDCSEIGAEFAAQRIQNLNLRNAVVDALIGSRRRGGKVITSLIDRFHYPRHGPGMMWERCVEMLAERGVATHLEQRVVRIRHADGRVQSVELRDSAGQLHEEAADSVISSMPLSELIRCLDPAPPTEVQEAAGLLRYRDYLTVVLIVDQPDLFPDNWIYIHSPEVKVGRVQNYKNWSPDMVPDPRHSSLGLEYFTQDTDDFWHLSDDELIAIGTREAVRIGLVDEADILDGCVVRMPKAYPVYDSRYADAVLQIRGYLDGLSNLESVGRNGQHRYNNQDHSMLTAIYAAQNLAGAQHDVWNVNVDEEYHEEVREPSSAPSGDRLVPSRVSSRLPLDQLSTLFARYDPVALGGAVGSIAAVTLLLATVVLLLRGGDPVGPTLSLLANFLLGYQVSWGGALLGFFEAGIGGFAFGFGLAKVINAVVGWHERALWRKIEISRLDILDGNPGS